MTDPRDVQGQAMLRTNFTIPEGVYRVKFPGFRIPPTLGKGAGVEIRLRPPRIIIAPILINRVSRPFSCCGVSKYGEIHNLQ